MRWDEGKEIEEENPLRQQENQERGESKKNEERLLFQMLL